MNEETPIWLFDLGNSRLKGACLRGAELSQPFALQWENMKTRSSADFDAALRAQFSQWPEPRRILIASVASAARADRLRAALQAWPQADVQWVRSPRQKCGITNRYRSPERLGIDRFLAMIAARAAAGDDSVVVIGCGTALTLDAVDADGVQQEGLIAPSPQLMLRSLQAGTAIEAGNPDAFNDETDDTSQALRAGCTRAAAALVERYDADNRAVLGDASLWLHGGGAAELRKSLRGDTAARAEILEDAVLRGLVLWAMQDPMQ